MMPIVEEIASDVRIQKIAVWVLTLCALRVISPFYVVTSLTFLLTFLGSSCIDGAQRLYVSIARTVVAWLGGVKPDAGSKWARELLVKLDEEENARRASPSSFSKKKRKSPMWLVPPRKVFAASYVFGVLSLTAWVIVHYAPIAARESQYVTSIIARDDPYVTAAAAMKTGLGDGMCARLDTLARSLRLEDFFLSSTTNAQSAAISTESLASTLRQLVSPYLVKVVALCSAALKPASTFLYDAATAGIFSLLIVWDLPRLATNFGALARSSVPWISFTYKEVAPKVRSLAKLVGTNFEIQGLIAVVNTALTTAGLAFLGVSGIPFLAFLTFVCSFVPILGVVIATAPACFIALAESGVAKLLEVLLMVTVVHFVEAYVLYPQIYASKLKVHPILVLASLYVFDHLFGWRGLFIALPVSVFILQTILGIGPPSAAAASAIPTAAKPLVTVDKVQQQDPPQPTSSSSSSK